MRFVFIDVDGREVAVDGPEQARVIVAEGRLGPETLVRTEPAGPWRPAHEALPIEQFLDPSQRAAARLVRPRRYLGPGRHARSPKAALRIVGMVFMLLGAAGLVIAGGVALWTWNGFASRTPVQGTVVELEGKWGNSTAVRPVVSFVAADGRSYIYRSPVTSSAPMFDVGDAVTVYYDPADPTDAMIDHWTQWFFALLPGGIGIVFFLVGLGLRIGGREPRAPAMAGRASAVERRR